MELKVIKGGKAKDNIVCYDYMKGYVTDTRLMGVLGLHLHFKKKVEDFEVQNIHYFLYYDIEEIGLDSIKVLQINDPKSVDLAEKSSFGGLGAKMIYVNEKEARYLVKEFVNGTKNKKKPLPLEIGDIKFLISDFDNPLYAMTDEEIDALNQKMCTNISNDFGLINYYIMRCIGKDYDGARLICNNNLPIELFEDLSLKHHGTFLQNSIEKFVDNKGNESYLCQSLIDTDNSYKLLQSELKIEDGKVIYAKKRSVMPISIQEASLMLSQCEYVSVYEIVNNMDAFDVDFSMYSVGFTKTLHDSGALYMEFKPDNLHAEKSEFNLSDDIKAIYFVSDFGQLLVGAYSLDDIIQTEKKIENDMLSIDVIPSIKYQFEQSVIYEFALSGMPDFEEFIKMYE